MSPNVRKPPAAPPVYRPQPTPKVLQLKVRPGSLAVKSATASPRPSVPVAPTKRETIQTHVNQQRRPLNTNRPPVVGHQGQRHLRPSPASRVVQRAIDKNADRFEQTPRDLVLLIMRFIGMNSYEGQRPLLKLALTSKKMYDIANDVQSPLGHARAVLAAGSITGLLGNYSATLEPILHGAHLNIHRVGLPGSATVLALAINGTLVSWSDVDQAFLDDEGHLKRGDWEAHVKQKVTKFSELSVKSMPARERIQAGQALSAKDKKRAQKAEISITTAREHSPAQVFEVFLLVNGSSAAQFEGQVKKWLQIRTEMLHHVLKESQVTEYQNLAATVEEYGACGHSEQLMLMRKGWETLRLNLFELAVWKSAHPTEWLQPQQIVIMLNRSPCTSCGRHLVAELEAFWFVLGKTLGLTASLCRVQFGRFFIFRLGYTVEYGKQTQKSKAYPNSIILKALEQAGWTLEKLPNMSTAQRAPEACFDTATIASLKTQSVDIQQLEYEHVSSDEEYVPSGGESDDFEDDSDNAKPRKKGRW